MSYENYNPIADKILCPDGSIKSMSLATTVYPASEQGALDYLRSNPSPAKFLLSDGSIVEGIPLSTVISGTATPGYIVTVDSDGGLVYDKGIINPLVYKGAIDCSTNPNFPAANAGYQYKISVAGRIGGTSGPVVQVGDMLICTLDGSPAGDYATVGTNWDIIQSNIDIQPATAQNDFLVGGPSPFGWVRQTLEQVKVILGLAGILPATTAPNDFIISAGSPVAWAKKTLVEFLAIVMPSPGPIGGTTPAAGAFTSVNWAKPTNIADSATPAIGAAAGNVLDLDGATTITGFDTVAAGITRMVRFTDIRILTYNATSLILPGSRNITTAVGDRAEFISLGSGNWYCFAYLKASGIAIGNIDEQIAAATGNLSLPQAYGGVINNYGQTTDCEITLPTCTKGMNFSFIAGASIAKYYRFITATGNTIYLNGITTGANKYVQTASVAIGSCISFIATQTDASTWAWNAYIVNGTWTQQA